MHDYVATVKSRYIVWAQSIYVNSIFRTFFSYVGLVVGLKKICICSLLITIVFFLYLPILYLIKSMFDYIQGKQKKTNKIMQKNVFSM
ncbi:hypothetical protein RhiirC2_299 [Rhizophagus irregularis]|uniref:Uncharacterized protein n=1 Tax=Rhizophagus irregularis TaxID=588596 RepID=A0A2N1P4A1_9GLOM|nr:hypothetical protein RhiirC2_299 [Rhizophagus irregularis]